MRWTVLGAAVLLSGCLQGQHPLLLEFADADERVLGSEDARWDKDRAHHVVRVPPAVTDFRVALAVASDAEFRVFLSDPDGDVAKVLDSPQDLDLRTDDWFRTFGPEFGSWRVDLEANEGRVYYAFGFYWNTTRPSAAP